VVNNKNIVVLFFSFFSLKSPWRSIPIPGPADAADSDAEDEEDLSKSWATLEDYLLDRTVWPTTPGLPPTTSTTELTARDKRAAALRTAAAHCVLAAARKQRAKAALADSQAAAALARRRYAGTVVGDDAAASGCDSPGWLMPWEEAALSTCAWAAAWALALSGRGWFDPVFEPRSTAGGAGGTLRVSMRCSETGTVVRVTISFSLPSPSAAEPLRSDGRCCNTCASHTLEVPPVIVEESVLERSDRVPPAEAVRIIERAVCSGGHRDSKATCALVTAISL
jgi:hypothetical protein